MFYTFYCIRCSREIKVEAPRYIPISAAIMTCDECRKEPVQLRFDWEKNINQ